MDPIRTAATGMAAQQRRIEVISNNLANVNTTAFKRSRAHFEDLLYTTQQGATNVDQPGAQTLNEIQIGRGVRLAAVQRSDMQGAMESTGRATDLAILGTGFFQVEMPDGTLAFTRDGNFNVSDQGVLVTNGGYTVAPGITIPQGVTALSIGKSGIISVNDETGETLEIGQLQLARFNNPGGLSAIGENLFRQTPASGEPIEGFPEIDGFGRVMQGALETSNVELVQEMVDMITAMRAYEINSKAVQTAEEMAQVANQLVR